jgi:hypothetical protein
MSAHFGTSPVEERHPAPGGAAVHKPPDHPADNPAPRSLPRLWPYLASCAVAALWVDLGSIHRGHQADSLLNILVSLQCWTLFMWDQDRFGMLVPLLAAPVRNPLANLLVQEFAAIFAGLSVFYLLARHVVRSALYPLTATLGAAGFLAFASTFYRFEYLIDNSFGLGLALALGGLILLEPRAGGITPARWTAALALMVLAHWVNCGMAVFLGPLAICRALAGFWVERETVEPALRLANQAAASAADLTRFCVRRVVNRDGWPDSLERATAAIRHAANRKRSVSGLPHAAVTRARTLLAHELPRDLVGLGFGYLAGRVLIGLVRTYMPTQYDGLPIAEWPGSWLATAFRTWTDLAPQYWPALLAVEAALGLVVAWRAGRRRSPWDAVALAGGLVSAALAVAIVTGTRRWVALNGFPSRYYIPAVLLLQAACAVLAVGAIAATISSKAVRRLNFLSMPLLLVASASAYGFPSIAGVRADIDRLCGAMTADLVDGRCTHLAGEYWSTWPAVFHANLVLYERGVDRTLWGISLRCNPSHTRWRSMPREAMRVGIPRGDGFGQLWLNSFTFNCVNEIEQRPTLRILSVCPLGPAPATHHRTTQFSNLSPSTVSNVGRPR